MDEPQEPATTPDELAVGQVAPRWTTVIEDMHATAAEYEAEGLETVQLHPGDVTILAGDTPDGREGIDVLVPGEEFERLTDVVEGRTFDEFDVFRATEGGFVFILSVVTDTEEEVAVFIPAYYDVSDVQTLHGTAADGTVTTHVRRLQNERRVTFEQDEPELFLPDDEE